MVCTHHKFVCAVCRTVDKDCQHEKIVVSAKWRAPKKRNHKAWKRIANGELLWDSVAISNKELKARRDYNERKFNGKEEALTSAREN
jgi:hypothetical protein